MLHAEDIENNNTMMEDEDGKRKCTAKMERTTSSLSSSSQPSRIPVKKRKPSEKFSLPVEKITSPKMEVKKQQQQKDIKKLVTSIPILHPTTLTTSVAEMDDPILKKDFPEKIEEVASNQDIFIPNKSSSCGANFPSFFDPGVTSGKRRHSEAKVKDSPLESNSSTEKRFLLIARTDSSVANKVEKKYIPLEVGPEDIPPPAKPKIFYSKTDCRVKRGNSPPRNAVVVLKDADRLNENDSNNNQKKVVKQCGGAVIATSKKVVDDKKQKSENCKANSHTAENTSAYHRCMLPIPVPCVPTTPKEHVSNEKQLVPLRKEKVNPQQLQMHSRESSRGSSPNQKRFQLYARDKPRDDVRMASFRALPPPPSRSQQQSSRESSAVSPSWRNAGALVPRKSSKTSVGPKNFSSATYEGIFYRKKAYSEKGSASLRSRANTSNNAAYETDAHFHSQQRTVLTKIITETETNYEYEEDDENNDQKINTKYDRRNNTPTKSMLVKSKPKSQRVTIIDPLAKYNSGSSDKKKRITDNPNREGRMLQQSSDIQKISDGNRSRIPCMILPGHGNPHLEFPDPGIKSDAGESSVDVKIETTKPTKSCGKCKTYKNLLYQSEATVRYLTQMLVVKDQEIENFNRSCNGSCFEPVQKQSNHSSPGLNPLLSKSEAVAEGTTSNSSDKPRASTQSCAIPKFDLDEFIRKYFNNLLFTKDFRNSRNEPFAPLQLFRVAISVRDCMAQVVKHKLKHANDILKQKYDILMSMKSSTTDASNESAYFAVLDSYRRFVRYIYYYFKESVKHVEHFEQTYISLDKNAETDEPKSRILYSQEITATINGKRYSGVFIPVQEISPEEDEG